MNKHQLIEELSLKTDMSRVQTNRFIDAFVDTVSDALEKGDRVQLIGFGTFETRERAARTGRNPKTGGTINIGASITPAFKAGKALKDAVNK